MSAFALKRSLWVLALCACNGLQIDHTPAGDLIDAQTTSVEDGTGLWSAWYSTTISHDTSSAAVGHGSLGVQITKPYGWGVSTDNFPGYAATAGDYRAELWAHATTGAIAMTVEAHWVDDNGNDVMTEVPTLDAGTLPTAWQHYSFETTAPTGTKFLQLELRGRTEESGDALEIDEVRVSPKP